MDKRILYEKIAEKYHTTPEEVYREMQVAINAAFDSNDPAVRREWDQVRFCGEKPTPEEVIDYAVGKLTNH
jgi:hypothetical protein